MLFRSPAVTKPESDAGRGSSAGVWTVFKNVHMILMVLLGAGFSLGFLLINFFYVDKLMACGLREEWMSPIIIAYSVVQMSAEKMLDRIEAVHYRTAMLVSVILSGMVMILFAFCRMTVAVVGIMVLLPLLLSFPAYILESMQNQDNF